MASSIDEFIDTIARLRAPDGCPWDRDQDHKSLGRYLLEEAYEVLEAIHKDEPEKLKEELGDLLLQIVLHAQIAKEDGAYDFYQVAEGINAKMLARHPHVFGDSKVDSAAEVVAQWEELKKEEARAKAASGDSPEQQPLSSVDNVPNALPALLKALKVSEKAVSEGFEWRDFNELWTKVESEVAELKEAIEAPESDTKLDEIELEIADVLFCLVNVARWHKLNPEESLLKGIEKFRTRYRMMEALADEPLRSKSKEDLAKLWNQAKQRL